MKKLVVLYLIALTFSTSLLAGTRKTGIHRYQLEWDLTPPYDIINQNIHVWAYTENGINYGFSITGHARAEVCEVASFNVFNSLQKMQTGGDYLAAGVAFSKRVKTDKSYDQIISNLMQNLEVLSREKGDIYIHDLSPGSDQVNLVTMWNNMREYDCPVLFRYSRNDYDGPVFLPFYYIDSKEKIAKLRFNLNNDEIESFSQFYRPFKTALRNNTDALFSDIQSRYKEQIESNEQKIELLNALKRNLEIIRQKDERVGEFERGITVTGYSQKEIDRKKAILNIEFEQLEKDLHSLRQKEKSLLDLLLKNNAIIFNSLSPDPDRELFRYPQDLDFALSFGNEATITLKNAVDGMKELQHFVRIEKFSDFEKASILESVIRDWPLAFSPTEVEGVFDDYKYRNRQRIWRHFNKQLETKNIHISKDNRPEIQPDIFAKENVIYFTDVKNKNYLIHPFSVTGGNFVIQLDPSTNLFCTKSAWSERNAKERVYLKGNDFFQSQIRNLTEKTLIIDNETDCSYFSPIFGDICVNIGRLADSENIKNNLAILENDNNESNILNVIDSFKLLLGKSGQSLSSVKLSRCDETEIKLDIHNNLFISIKNADGLELASISEQVLSNSNIENLYHLRGVNAFKNGQATVAAFTDDAIHENLFVTFQNSNQELIIRKLDVSRTDVNKKHAVITQQLGGSLEQLDESLDFLYHHLLKPIDLSSGSDKYIIFKEFGDLNFPLLFNYSHEGGKAAIIDNPNLESTLSNLASKTPFSFQTSKNDPNHQFFFLLPVTREEFHKSRIKNSYNNNWEHYNEHLDIWKKVLNRAAEMGSKVFYDPNYETLSNHFSQNQQTSFNLGMTFIGEETSKGVEVKRTGAYIIPRKREVISNSTLLNTVKNKTKQMNSVLPHIQLFSCNSKNKLAHAFINENVLSTAFAFNTYITPQFAAYTLDKLISKIDGEKTHSEIAIDVQKEIMGEIKKALRNPQGKHFKFSFGMEYDIFELLNVLDEFPILMAQNQQ